MKRLATALTAALMTTFVMVAAPAAHAGTEHAPPWRWTTVTIPRTDVPIGTQYDVTLNCPSGYRPVSWIWGSSFDNAATTLTLQAETLDYSTNSGLLRVYNNTSHDDAVDATLNCVDGADIGTVTTSTTVVWHLFGNAGGFVQCPFGTTILGGSASWDVVSPNSRLDFVAPTSSGWYATGSTTAFVTANLTISVHCVSSSVASGVHIAQTSTTADPNAQGLVTATANCNSDERAANAGAYEHPDNSSIDATKTLGRIRRIPQYPLPGQASVKATEPNTTTTLVVFVICLPYAIPSVSITSPAPLGLQGSRDIAFTFTATDTAGYELVLTCKLYKTTENSFFFYRDAPCDPTMSNTVTGIEDGEYLLAVSGTNGDNLSSEAGRDFTIDATAPSVAVGGKPADPTASKSASFTVIATDAHPGTTYCHLDGDAEQVCPTPATYADLPDGVHTFRWRAVDAAGNENAGSYSWAVDTTAPPAPSIGTHPADPTNATKATLAFTDSEAGVTFSCSIDGGAFSACASGTSYSGLAEGSHTFRVKATDGAANASTPTAITWTVDLTPPETSVDTGPSGPVSSTSASFTFASEAGATFACARDGGAFATCASPKSYTGLPQGQHTFAVRATDTAGNTDSTLATRTWTVDTAAPQTTITAGPTGTVTVHKATFQFISERGSTFRCSLDGRAFRACTSPRTYTELRGGPHVFRVKARDQAGNVDGTAAVRRWTVK